MWLPLVLLLVSSTAYTLTTGEHQEDEIFITKPIDTVGYEEEPTTMNCKASKSLLVNKCRWIWKADLKNSSHELQVNEFKAFGEDGNDCSMIMSNLTLIQEGFWTCILLLHNQTIYRSPSAQLTVLKKITFLQTPQNTKLVEDDRLALECSTENVIEDCQWLFRFSNISDMMQVAMFKAIKHKNCTMEFQSVDKKHTGYWRCGVRRNGIEDFTYTDEAYVTVYDKEIVVNFAETPVDTVFAVGSNGSIQCTVLDQVQQCRWFWQPQGYGDEWRVLMKEFPPEDDHDCSLHFKDITTEPEGMWMCAVLPFNSTTYFNTKPVTLRIKTLIEFTVLTRAVVVAEGMETSLRCQTEADVEECRWRWHQLGDASAPSVVVSKFPPFGPTSQDCSIQFINMLMEQQGVWVCGVRLRNETDFKEAMPTTVSLKPAGRVRILEISQPITIAEKEHLTLSCITSASVNDCVWEWKPINTSLLPDAIHFSPNSKDSRNCSLSIDSVEMKHDGFWKCSVKAKREKEPVKASTDPVRITVIKPVPVEFQNVANVIHASPGSSCQLACKVSNEVDLCRWKFIGKPDVVKAEFPPINGTDCSLNLLDLQVLNSGIWQCGVKNIGQYHFNWAPPTTLNVLHTENVTASYEFSDATNQLSLMCHLETQLPKSIMNCQWLHPTESNKSSLSNAIYSYNEYFDDNNGDCILEFHTHSSDPGIWQCLYTVDTENGTWKLGEAKFVVISNPDNLRLRLMVGILAATTVILAIVLGIVIIYGCPWTTSKARDKLGNSNCPPPIPSKQSVRYTEEPGKINFHFQETPKLLVDLPSTPSNHVYERVGQYVLPATTKNIYQNVK